MKTKLRNRIEQADLDELANIHRALQKLMIGMNPASECHAPLFAAMATVQACGAAWSGDGEIWRKRDSIKTGSAWD